MASGRLQSCRQRPTVLQEDGLKRPDLDTLAFVNPECHLFRRPGGAHLPVRTVYGHDRLRLGRWRTWGEECSERRDSALGKTKSPEDTAIDVLNPLDEGWGVRSTARLIQVSKVTGARLLRMAGRHAEHFHDQHVQGLTPRALECDEQWSLGKKAAAMRRVVSWDHHSPAQAEFITDCKVN